MVNGGGWAYKHNNQVDIYFLLWWYYTIIITQYLLHHCMLIHHIPMNFPWFSMIFHSAETWFLMIFIVFFATSFGLPPHATERAVTTARCGATIRHYERHDEFITDVLMTAWCTSWWNLWWRRFICAYIYDI